MKHTAAALAMSGGLLFAGSAQALVINLTATGNAQADAGFQAAANFLQAQFNDAVDLNITAGFASLGGSILGQASSTTVNTTFASTKSLLNADQTSADDATMVAGLPGGSTYSKYMNNPVTDAAAVRSGISSMRMTRGNAKALGLVAGNAAGQDAAITFSSDFTFDFDPTDGINAGAIDFVGVAIHELMHAMGFTSGVDILDINQAGSNPPNGPFPDSAFDPFVTVLDFTRVSAASITAGADIDWTADTRAKDYSIDGGATALISNAWSTGVNFGDGRQASHWKDGLGIGIMDPTSAPAGTANVVTFNDLQALDVIGWDKSAVTGVPEPTTAALLALGLLGAGAARRRREHRA